MPSWTAGASVFAERAPRWRHGGATRCARWRAPVVAVERACRRVGAAARALLASVADDHSEERDMSKTTTTHTAYLVAPLFFAAMLVSGCGGADDTGFDDEIDDTEESADTDESVGEAQS